MPSHEKLHWNGHRLCTYILYPKEFPPLFLLFYSQCKKRTRLLVVAFMKNSSIAVPTPNLKAAYIIKRIIIFKMHINTFKYRKKMLTIKYVSICLNIFLIVQ